MLLKRIEIAPATDEEFLEASKFWFPRTFADTRETKLKIIKPITYNNYHSLLMDFLSDEFADRISFFENGRYQKIYTRKLNINIDIDRIANAAEADKVKQNHLELQFHKRFEFYTACMKIAEINGNIVGYHIHLPPEYYDCFDAKETPEFNAPRLQAIWLPSLEERIKRKTNTLF